MLLKLKNLLQAEIDPAFAKRASFIFSEIENKKPSRILDVGCGRGFYVQAVTYYDFIAEIQGIDINASYLKKARSVIKDRRVRLNQASIYSLPYPKNYFDCIILSEVLEHLTDEQKALLELKRVLKKDGIILLTVPYKKFPFLWDPLNWILMKALNMHINKNIWWLAGIWADHERLYTEQSLKKVISNSSLKIQKKEKYIQHCWPFSHFLLYGIGKNIIERCEIKAMSRFNTGNKTLGRVVSYLFSLPSVNEKKLLDQQSAVDLVALITK